MDDDREPQRLESDHFKLEEEIRPPHINPSRFQSEFETELDAANQGALSEEVCAEIREELDEIRIYMEIYQNFWEWADSFYIKSEDIPFRIQYQSPIKDIENRGMTKGMESFDGKQHLTLPQPPVHDLRSMEQLTLLVLDMADEAKSVGGIAEEMARSLRETLVEYLQDEPDESEPLFVAHARESLDEDEIDQMEAHFQKKLQSRIQYNLGSLDEKQYIIQKPDPSDKRRTIIELTTTGELWVDTHAHSESSREPINSILDNQVTAYLEVEEE